MSINYTELHSMPEDHVVAPGMHQVQDPIQTQMQVPYLHMQQIHRSPEESIPVGPNSSKVLCPSCRSTVFTRVEKVSTSKTHDFALKILCLTMFCLCPCCAIIPYCMESCKASNHFCPHCETFLGTYDH